jgi:fatty acid desaturase
MRTTDGLRPEPDLDGGGGVLLAPVSGPDLRRNLPKELFVKRPARFTAKFLFAVGVVAGCWTAVAVEPRWEVILPAVVVLGLFYAHLVELQHECLHEHAYRRRALNRLAGLGCGVAMLSSFWHYKYEHLRHHAFLGTPKNREFFNYRFERLGSLPGFVGCCFHLGRYRGVFADIGRSLAGRTNPTIAKPAVAVKVRAEYLAFATVLAAGIVATVLTRSPYLVWVWVLPALVVAEPVHFLVELPEHFGLDVQADPNILTNTRTVSTGRLGRWFTNGNDVHTAHHYHQGVPMTHVGMLDQLIADRIEVREPSYRSFYRGVITGRITYVPTDVRAAD